MSGIIQLVFVDDVVRQARYNSEGAKSKILRGWQVEYGPAFRKGHIVDDPDVPDRRPGNFQKGSVARRNKTLRPPTKRRPGMDGYKVD